MERYTLEEHEAYRKEQDEKAAEEAEEQRERMEKESARRAWLAENAGRSSGRARRRRGKPANRFVVGAA